MTKWEVVIPLFVAAIATIGSIIPVVLNNSYIRDKPDVYASIAPSTDSADLVLGNKGSAPATNLSVVVMSSVKIRNITNEFSATDVFTEENGIQIQIQKSHDVNNTLLQFFVPKLLQGTGSVIDMNLFLERSHTETPDFRVSLVYDQGSMGFKKGASFLDFYSEFLNSYINYYITLISYVFVAVYLFMIFYGRKLLKKKFVLELINDLIRIREEILSNDKTQDDFQINWSHHSRNYSTYGRRDWIFRFLNIFGLYDMLVLPAISDTNQIINNVKDFILINDVEKKIDERKLHPNMTDKLNLECLNLVNKALDIEWEKYK